MVSQRCPRCASGRVRRGYRPTPIWSKILFRYYLLCDNCNWEFKGFAIPGTVSTKPTKRQKKTNSAENHSRNTEETSVEETNDAEDIETSKNTKKKRVKVKFK
jgi:hypothetical protein